MGLNRNFFHIASLENAPLKTGAFNYTSARWRANIVAITK